MNKEVKEILDSIKYHIEEDDWFEIEGHYLKPLFDCITNLQQENKELNTRIKKANEFIENTPLYEITYDYNMEEELEIQNVSDETASNKLLNILNGRSDK